MQPGDAERRDSRSASVPKVTRSGMVAARWVQSEQAKAMLALRLWDGPPSGSNAVNGPGWAQDPGETPLRVQARAAGRNRLAFQDGSPVGG